MKSPAARQRLPALIIAGLLWAPGAATALTEHACDSPQAIPMSPAIAAARAQFDAAWADQPDGRFVAFTIPPPKRNPFDRTPPLEEETRPHEGLIQARDVRCVVRLGEGSSPARLHLIARLYRFHEGPGGWSRPLRDGVLVAFDLIEQNGAWTAVAQAERRTALMAEAILRQPAMATLPKRTPWREPVPGCARGESWNGDACVPRRRK